MKVYLDPNPLNYNILIPKPSNHSRCSFLKRQNDCFRKCKTTPTSPHPEIAEEQLDKFLLFSKTQKKIKKGRNMLRMFKMYYDVIKKKEALLEGVD